MVTDHFTTSPEGLCTVDELEGHTLTRVRVASHAAPVRAADGMSTIEVGSSMAFLGESGLPPAVYGTHGFSFDGNSHQSSISYGTTTLVTVR